MLPLLELVLWVLLVPVPTTLMYLTLQQEPAARHQTMLRDADDHSVRIAADRALPMALYGATKGQATFLWSLNIPGVLIGLAFDIRTWPDEWHPSSLLVDTWRAISFPIFCLPFWWMVGRGLDALRDGRRLGWPLGLMGVIMSLAFAVAVAGCAVAFSERDRTDPLKFWIFGGLGIWLLLFGMVGFAWIRQLILRRRVAN